MRLIRYCPVIPRAWKAAVVSVFLGFSTNALAVTLAQVPVPHGTQVKIISSNSVHNGNALSLATYDSNLSLEETAEFYRTVWADSPDEQLPGVLETRTDEWLMLSRVRDGYNTVVQLSLAEPYRGSGFLSIMSLTGAAAFQGYGSSIPGIQLLSNTASDDGPRTSVVSVYSSGESVDTISQRFTQYLKSQKWSLVSVRDYQQNRVLLLNRQSSQIELVIGTTREQGTLVILNEVTDRG